MPGLLQFIAIARLTLIEAIRRPVFLLISLVCIGGILLMPLLLNYTLGDSARIIRDSALALYFLGGWLLAALAAGETLSRELRRGTAATILAKPVSRATFFLAKAAGIAAALLLYTLAALTAVLLAVRAGASDLQLDWTAARPALLALAAALAIAGAWNHRTRRPFTSAAFLLMLLLLPVALAIAACTPTPLENLTFPHNFSWEILRVGLLLYLGLGMAAALATALATRLTLTPVLLVTATFFILGLMSDSLLGPHVTHSRLALAAYTLLPNIQALWLLDALDTAQSIPAAYLATAAAYAATWAAVPLTLGVAACQKLEIT